MQQHDSVNLWIDSHNAHTIVTSDGFHYIIERESTTDCVGVGDSRDLSTADTSIPERESLIDVRHEID